MKFGDAIVRGLGADPGVFRPLYRAHVRMISRRARIARGGSRVSLRGISPFQFRCFVFVVFSLMMLPWIRGSASPVVGVALVLTVGAGLLLFDVLLDKFDVMADADEYQVIAAHPHDAWSVTLAKIAAIGRATAVLASCLFLFPTVMVGMVFGSVAVGLAFAVGAAGLSVGVSVGGMLVSGLLVATGGRRALGALVPILQTAYLVLYFGVVAARNALAHVSIPRLESLGWTQWALPSVWFAAPVELASRHAGPGTLVRAALALGSFAVLLPVSARWVRTRFDERILEPVRVRKPPRITRAKAQTVRRSVRLRAPGARAFWRVLVAHVRSDSAVRVGLVTAFLFPLVMGGGQVFGMGGSMKAEGIMVMSVTWVLFAESLLVRTAVRSSRPAAIWFVLIAPGARLPFSQSLATLVRAVLILPVVVAGAVYVAFAGSGPVWVRLAFVALVALLADSGLLMLRIQNPELPFSLPFRSSRPFLWSQLLGAAIAIVSVFALLIGFIFLVRWNAYAVLVPLGYAVAGRVGLEFWVRRKVGKVAREAEGT